MRKTAKLAAGMTAGIILISLTGCVIGKQSTMDEMSVLTKERVRVIKDFVEDSEQMLTHYSQTPRVAKLLSDPDNKELAEEVQKYTESYSDDIENIDGIYVGTFETEILAHTDRDVIGIVTRNDPDTRKALWDSLLSSGDQVYNAGIIMSPRIGSQTLSLYKGIYNEKDEPIGFTGFGVKTDALTESNHNIAVKGVKDAFFTMFNTENAKYIFAPETEQIWQEVQAEEIRSLCASFKGKDAAAEGTLAYKDDSGKYIAAYSYMPEYGWLLMLNVKS